MSVFLLAVGAVLAFAVEVHTQGLDLDAVGVILMIVGGIGLMMSFIWWDRMGFGGASAHRRTYVRDYDEPVVTTARPRRGVVRERIIEDDVV